MAQDGLLWGLFYSGPRAPRAGSLRLRAHSCPLKQRPHVGAAAAADPASELRLEVRQANFIAPASGIQDDRLSRVVV
jgi:hypothetical protein